MADSSNPLPLGDVAAGNNQDAKAAPNQKRKLPSSNGNGTNDGGEGVKTESSEGYQQSKRPRSQGRHPRGVPWFTMLERLKQYRVRHGTLNVPRILADDQKLASWVHYQRYLFHHKTIADERKAALDALGFEWTIADSKVGSRTTWDQHLAQLKEYKERFGDCLVPYTYKENKSLAYWVSRQRKDNNKGLLPADKVEKLNALGFSWNPTLGRRWSKNKEQRSRATNWEGQFEKLRALHELSANGTDLRSLIDQDKSLEAWMKNQRYLYSVKRMSADRVAKLDGIGFVWRIGVSWNDYLVRLKNHKENFGTFENITDPKLQEWVECQRISKYWKELSKERVDQLEAIGFIWESDKVSASQEEWKRVMATQDAQLLASIPNGPPGPGGQRVPPKPMLYANVPAGLDDKMPALVGQAGLDPSQEEMTQFLDSVNLDQATAPVATGPSQRATVASDVGDPNLNEYNIAIHLAGLGASVKEAAEEIAQNSHVEQPGPLAKEEHGTTAEAPGEAHPPNDSVGAAVEMKAEEGDANQKDDFDGLSTQEKNVVLAEEIVTLREETVELREAKIKVQEEKLELGREIQAIKTKNEELKKEVEAEEQDPEVVKVSAEKNEVEAKLKANQEKLTEIAAQIKDREATIQRLMAQCPPEEGENRAFV